MATREVPASETFFVSRPGSRVLLGLLADKWTIPVLHAPGRGTRRTGELRRELSGVSQKMLTQTLRRLERHRLIERTVFPVVPPRVEYHLIALGESINAPLTELCRWTERHGTLLESPERTIRRRAAE